MTNVVIFGAGTVGASVAEALSSEDNNVTVVDKDPKAMDHRLQKLDIKYVQGDAIDLEVLDQANIQDADLVLAVTDDDGTNILASHLSVLRARVPRVIARIRNHAYHKNREELFKTGDVDSHVAGEHERSDARDDRLRIDEIFNPERLVTEQIMRLVMHPGALQVVEFAGGRIQLVAVRADDTGKLVGHKIRELREHIPNVETRVAAVYQKYGGIIPHADTVIQPGDEVFFIATADHIEEVVTELRSVNTETGNRVMLVGAGHIGLALAEQMLAADMKVVLIEKQQQVAERAAQMLPKCLVICGDATDTDLLERENIAMMEVFCSVTDHDETNILSAMMAKQMGAKRTMALVNNSAFVDVLEHSGVDIVISPNLTSISEIFRHIRRGRTEAVHSLRRGAAEAIEAVVLDKSKETSNVVGRRVGELKLPEGTTIGAILRGERVYTTFDNLLIEPQDHVILFVVDKSGKRIKQIQKLFELKLGSIPSFWP